MAVSTKISKVEAGMMLWGLLLGMLSLPVRLRLVRCSIALLAMTAHHEIYIGKHLQYKAHETCSQQIGACVL